MSYKWDNRFLKLAEHVALWSKDPSTKCGAVIVDPSRRVVSLGYNGFPQRVSDDPSKLGNRNLKYARTLHAEKNALLFAYRKLNDCTLCTWPFMSCSVCAADYIQAGIVRHVAPVAEWPGWEESCATATELFTEAGVELVLIGASGNAAR